MKPKSNSMKRIRIYSIHNIARSLFLEKVSLAILSSNGKHADNLFKNCLKKAEVIFKFQEVEIEAIND